MNILEFTLVLGAGSLVAGFLGALTGLGGGVVIVPLLTLALGVDIRYAIGASLVSVIATSSGARPRYPLCDRRLAGLGDRHILRGGFGLCEGRLFEHSDWHVSGDCHRP